MTDMTDYETGTCNYIVKWKVYFHVSGNELLGPQEFMGEYATEFRASEALHEAGFAPPGDNSTFWRKSYTYGYITRVVEYDYN